MTTENEKDPQSAASPESKAVSEASEKPRVRKIVRSAATRASTTFSETPAGESQSTPGAQGPEAKGDAAPSGEAKPQNQEGRRIFDARAPRPAPGERRPGQGDRREGRPRFAGDRGDRRPPGPRRGAPSNDYPRPPNRPGAAGSRSGFGAGPSVADEDRPRQRRPVPLGPRRPERPGALSTRPREGGPPRTRDGAPRSRDDRESRRPREGGPGRPERGARPEAPAKRPLPIEVAKAAVQASITNTKAPKPAHVLGLPLPKAAPVHQKPALTAKEVLTARAQARSQGKPAKPANKEEAVTSKKVTFSQADLSAGWDDATEALRGAGEHASDLVEAWIVANNGAAVAAAAEADHQFANARKAAKRGLNVLKARGVAIPSRPHVAKLADDRAEVSIEATLIPPDSTGTVAIAIATRDASGRYRIAEAIVRENVGVLQAGGGWLSGSSLKEARARAEGSIGVAPVHVPVEWARHRVAEARKQNAASGQVIPLGYERCRELFEPAPEGAPAHPAADLERDLTSETAWAMAPGSLALHEEPEFRGWLPDRRAIDEMLRKVGESLGADGVKDNQKVTDALLAEANAATDRFFGPEVRNVIADRMRDCAISIRARKGNDKASEVLAVAKAIREAGLITSPPNQIPFLVAFFQKAIGLMAQQSGGSLRIPIPQQTAQAAT